MAPHGKGGPRRGAKGSAPAAGLPRVYEGPEVLSALLEQAGSALGAAEVSGRFAAAQASGRDRSEVIPTLFPAEPHFDSPDQARRLYGNLFGLWDRIAAGQGAGDDAPELAGGELPPPPLPERGSLGGDRIGPELVEAVW